MTRKKRLKRTTGGLMAGAIAAVLLTLGAIGLNGNGILPSSNSEVGEITEETGVTYAATVEIIEDKILVDGDYVEIDNLKETLQIAKNSKVLLIDNGATHGTWNTVGDILKELNCIVEEQ